MHPANETHDRAGAGQRAADKVAAAIGSWAFIGVQSAVIVGWITMNVIATAHHWDPYPYILLNLLFSTQAAYAAPILQLSQNSQSKHDRERAEHDFAVNQESLRLTKEIHDKVCGPYNGEVTNKEEVS